MSTAAARVPRAGSEPARQRSTSTIPWAVASIALIAVDQIVVRTAGQDLSASAANESVIALSAERVAVGHVRVQRHPVIAGQCEHLHEVVTAPPPPAVAIPGSAVPAPKA